MNTNNPKRFGWEAEASGTKPTLMQAGLEMIKAEQNAKEAANNLQNWIDTMQSNKHSGYSDYLMADNKVLKRKSSNLGLCFAAVAVAAAVAIILGSIIAILEINGYLPQILPTFLGGGPL